MTFTKYAVILLLCGLATAQQDELTKFETASDENLEEDTTNLGTGQPCSDIHWQISYKKKYLDTAQKNLDDSASCANFPGIQSTIKNKMCKDYKKLTPKEDDDKDITKEECGKMVLSDEECNKGKGWFAQKSGKRCYGCTSFTNSSNLFPSNTMTASQTKSCVLQGEYDKKVQDVADKKKIWREAIDSMRKCQGDVLQMCQNNQYYNQQKQNELTYFVGEGMNCKEEKWIGYVTWNKDSYEGKRSDECAGKELGAVYYSKEPSRSGGYDTYCCTKLDSAADIVVDTTGKRKMEMKFNALKFCSIDPEAQEAFLSNFMQLEPAIPATDVSIEGNKGSNSTYYLMGGMAGTMLIFSLKFFKKDNKDGNSKQAALL